MSDDKPSRLKKLKEAGQKKLDSWLQDKIVDPAYELDEDLGDLAAGGAAVGSAGYDMLVPDSEADLAMAALPVGRLGKAASKAIDPQHLRQWNRALENAREMPGELEKILAKGRDAFVEELEVADALLRKRGRDMSDGARRYRERTDIPVADSIDYGGGIQKNAFLSTSQGLSDPKVTATRKRK